MGMSSRRRTLRIHCDLPARWSTGEDVGPTRVLNVSADGLLLEGERNLRPGDRLDLVVELADRAVALATEVRFSGPTRHGGGCGVAIVNAPADDQARWQAHYRGLVDRAVAKVPHSIGAYLRRRTGTER